MTIRVKLISIILALILTVSAAGCAEPEGKGGGYLYCLGSSVASLDPQTAGGNDAHTVIKAVFEGLCRLDAEGKAVAGVAESWEQSGMEYTFYLDEKAVWSNGEQVTAHDFVFAIRRALDPDTGAKDIDELFIINNAKEANKGLVPVEQVGVRAVDDETVVFQLTSAISDFPEMTAGVRFMPCNETFFRETGGRYGLAQRYLLTNGPFMFNGSYAWSVNEYFSLAMNPDYVGELKVNPQTLMFSMGFEVEGYTEEEGYIAVANGELDMIEVSPDDLQDAIAAGCEIVTYTNYVTGLMLNPNSEALSVPEIRELFVRSIDKSEFLSELPEGASAATDIIPSGLSVGSANYRSAAESGLSVGRDYSIQERINESLTAAGLSNVPSITVLCTESGSDTRIANGLISSWGSNLGSYCNMEPLDDYSYRSKLYDRDYQMALCTVGSEDGTVYSMLKSFESSSSPRLLNSDAFDALLHRESSIVNYMAAEKFLSNQYIFYPLFWQETYYAVNPEITGLVVDYGCPDFISAEK